MIPLRFRIVSRRTGGLQQAPAILRKNLRGGLEAVGKHLVESSRARMRKDTGREHKSLKIRVSGSGLDLNVLVFSTLVQAFVDAYGLKRGVFPNSRVNSSLYKWVERRLGGIPVKSVKTIGVPKGRHTRRQIPVVKRIHTISGPSTPLNAVRRAKAKNRDAKRIAFLIARAIFRQGREATHWNRKALEANKGRIIREMSNALARSANDMKRASV